MLLASVLPSAFLLALLSPQALPLAWELRWG